MQNQDLSAATYRLAAKTVPSSPEGRCPKIREFTNPNPNHPRLRQPFHAVAGLHPHS